MTKSKLFALTFSGLILLSCGDSKKVASLSDESLVAVSGSQLERTLKNGLRRALENNHKDSDGDGIYYPFEPLWVGSNTVDPTPPVRAKNSIFEGPLWFIATDEQDTFYDQNPANGFAVVSLDLNSGSAAHVGKYKEPENTQSLIFTQNFSDASEFGFRSIQAETGRL